jgi:hypothetical protein
VLSQTAKALVQRQPDLLVIRPFELKATYQRLVAATGGLRRHVFSRRCALLRMRAAEMDAWVHQAKQVLGEKLALTVLRNYPPLLLVPARSLASSWSGAVEQLGEAFAPAVVADAPLVLTLDRLLPTRMQSLRQVLGAEEALTAVIKR